MGLRVMFTRQVKQVERIIRIWKFGHAMAKIMQLTVSTAGLMLQNINVSFKHKFVNCKIEQAMRVVSLLTGVRRLP